MLAIFTVIYTQSGFPIWQYPFHLNHMIISYHNTVVQSCYNYLFLSAFSGISCLSICHGLGSKALVPKHKWNGNIGPWTEFSHKLLLWLCNILDPLCAQKYVDAGINNLLKMKLAKFGCQQTNVHTRYANRRVHHDCTTHHHTATETLHFAVLKYCGRWADCLICAHLWTTCSTQ